MKHILQSLLAASLVLGAAAPLHAEDQPEASKPARKGEGRKRAERPKLTAEERAARLAKAKEKAEARLKALKEKQAAGTLTDQEAKQLERLSKRLEKTGKDDPKTDHKSEHKAEHKADAEAKSGNS